MKKQHQNLVSFILLLNFLFASPAISNTILISDKAKIIDGDTIVIDKNKIS